MNLEEHTAVSKAEIDDFRETFCKYFMAFLWFNVVLVAGTLYARGAMMSVELSVFAVIAAAVPTYLWKKGGATAGVRYSSSAVIAVLVGMLVSAFSGSIYQIDVHMYFFATLAIMVGWCDWRAIVVNTGVIAVHHLVLNFVFPLVLFPEGADLIRVIGHAVVVVVEAAFLSWVTYRLAGAMNQAELATSQAMLAQTNAENMTKEQASTRAAEENRQTDVSVLVSDFRNDVQEMLGTVFQNMDAMREAASELNADTEATHTHMETSRQAADHAANSVTTVASAAEELSATIHNIGEKTSQTTEVVQTAAVATQESTEKVSKLAESAQKIGAVLGLIQAIAEQTNLLALNATIEAARAGDAGKGFAVVAAEVKELANQTAKATDEIASQIAEIQNSTDASVASIEDIASRMEKANEFVVSISAAIEEQGTATSEISQNVQLAAEGTSQVTSNMEALSTSVGRSKGSIDNLVGNANEIAQHNRSLRRIIDTFLEKVEAA